MAKKKKWIKSATEHANGQFAEKAEKAGESTAQFARQESHAAGKLGKEARLAETLIGMRKPRRSAVLYDKKR